jgi:hypothetical protein
MLSRIFHRSQPKPDFPERVSFPHLTDDEAARALDLLRLMVEQGYARVYTQAYTAPVQWLVWLEPGERLPLRLETWAIEALFPGVSSKSGGDAA